MNIKNILATFLFLLYILYPLMFLACGCCYDKKKIEGEEKEKIRDKECLQNDSKILKKNEILKDMWSFLKTADYITGKKPVEGYHGFENVRYMCYMNAVMHCLLHTKGYVDWLNNQNWDIETEKKGYEIAQKAFESDKDNENLRKLFLKAEDFLKQCEVNSSFKEMISLYKEKNNGRVLSWKKFLETNKKIFPDFFSDRENPIAETVGNSKKEKPIVETVGISKKSIWQHIVDWFADLFSTTTQSGLDTQHDPHEFLEIFLGLSCTGKDNNSRFDGFSFGLQSDFRKKCKKCGDLPIEKPTIENPCRCLQLNFLGDKKEDCNFLSDCLEKFCKPQDLIDVDCSNKKSCGRKLETCTKNDKIFDIHKYLIIHLVRFKNNLTKIEKTVVFPEKLNIKPFCTDEALKKGVGPKYKLYAVLYHYGSILNGGHYVAACKEDDNGWSLYNDEEVKRIEKFNTAGEDILEKLSPEQRKIMPHSKENPNTLYISKNAYMLFYERIDDTEV